MKKERTMMSKEKEMKIYDLRSMQQLRNQEQDITSISALRTKRGKRLKKSLTPKPVEHAAVYSLKTKTENVGYSV